MTATAKGAISVVGIIVLAVGMLALIGLVPSLAVVVTAPGGAGFSYTGSGYTVTVTDHSVLPTPFSCPPSFSGCYHTINATLLSLKLSWGDGSSLIPMTLGASASHTYRSSTATYAVNETLTYYECFTLVGGGSTVNRPTTGCTTIASLASATITLPFACSTSCGSGQSSVNPAFVVAYPGGLTISVHDNSTTVNATITSIAFTFGDGSAAVTGLTQYGTTTHTYATSGTYNVQEAVSWKNAITGVAQPTAYVNTTVSMTPTPTGCSPGSGGCPIGSPGPSSSSVVFNAMTALWISTGVVLIVFPWLPSSLPVRLASGAVVVVLVVILGWFFGGLGTL